MTWIRNRPLGLVYRDAKKSAGGYTLFSPVRGRHADLVDDEGRIVYQWRHPDGIQHLKLLPDGNLLAHGVPPETGEGQEQIGGNAPVMYELDPSSQVVWQYDDPYMHHDYQRLDNGNTLLCRWAKLPPGVAREVKGGWTSPKDPDWMWADEIREIDRSGATVREWRSWEHLSTEHHVKCPLESRKEWTHLNSLELTPTGDWLLSFRLTDTVVRVDGQTGDVRWRWGPGVLSHQHHAQWLDNGNVLIFDNGCHRREAPSFSQIVEVDPETSEIAWTYKAQPILAFYSFMVSGCQRLANGNTAITEGATGRIFEVTKDGETVWEYVSPWLMESRFGPATAVFRSYRIAADDPRLAGLDLSPDRYRALNQRIAGGDMLTAADEGLPTKAKKRPATKKKTAPVKAAAKNKGAPKKKAVRRAR